MRSAPPLIRLAVESYTLDAEAELRPDDNTTSAVLRYQGRSRLERMREQKARLLTLAGALLVSAGVVLVGSGHEARDTVAEVGGASGVILGLATLGTLAIQYGRSVRDIYRAHQVETHPEACPVLGAPSPESIPPGQG